MKNFLPFRSFHYCRRLLAHEPRSIKVVLGIACSGHGASLALMTREGVVRSSVLDRWAGVKHLLLLSRKEDHDLRYPNCDIDRFVNSCLSFGYGAFPRTNIFEEIIDDWMDWFLQGLPLRASDVDLIVVTDSHFAVCQARLGRKLTRWFPNASVVHDVEHHQLHQRQAFWQSGFTEAAVVTLDSSGEPLERLGGRLLAGTIAFMTNDGTCSVLSEILFPESSPGALYEVITRHVGFRMGDEGKTMGLAPYGGPELLHRLEPLLELHDDGSFKFLPQDVLRELLQEYVPERWPYEPMSDRHRNVAYAGQALLERIVTNVFCAAHRLTGCRDLAYSGGVALNSVANEIAARAAGTGKFYIAPNPGDTGQSLGAALYGAYEVARWPPPSVEITDYLGPVYDERVIVAAAEAQSYPVTATENIERDLARCIANGYITARFAGPAEFGPRALGNRSILCDPRGHHMKAYLNAQVKHREDFRPFAPAVLEEQAGNWFDMDFPSEYMLRVVSVRETVRDRIPAVVHVDGSCRVQTVSQRSNPGFYRVIDEFAALTGVPVLLNTSFNIAGKPIIETPEDAIKCFTDTSIDVLALGPVLISKRPLHEYLEQPAASLTLAGDEVHVWRAELNASSIALCLNPEEQERAARYSQLHLRQRFIAARSFLRAVLGLYLNVTPSSIRFSYGANGKPRLADLDGLHFNLSHSEDRAVLAVTKSHEVGIDIERVRLMGDCIGLARRYFSSAEVDWLETFPISQRQRAFFSCWTAKEAYIKARGDGLSFPLDAFQTFKSGELLPRLQVHGDPAESRRWCLRPFYFAQDEVVTLASSLLEPVLNVFEYRSMLRNDPMSECG